MFHMMVGGRETSEADDNMRREPISLNQEFTLFQLQPELTKIVKKKGVVRSIETTIQLTTPFAKNIPFRVLSMERGNSLGNAGIGFTPFSRNEGYQVDNKDFDPNLRAQKLEEILNTLRESNPATGEDELVKEFMDPSKYPLSLAIVLSNEDSYKAGLAEDQGLPKSSTLKYQIYPEIEEELKKLKLSLTFPEIQSDLNDRTSFTSNPISTSGLAFHIFYPTDTGPLATSSYGMEVTAFPGLRLFLPADLNLLSQIKGKFVR